MNNKNDMMQLLQSWFEPTDQLGSKSKSEITVGIKTLDGSYSGIVINNSVSESSILLLKEKDSLRMIYVSRIIEVILVNDSVLEKKIVERIPVGFRKE